MKATAAFFDIDGTLARNSMMIAHFKRLIKQKVIDERYWEEDIRPIYETYSRRHIDYDAYLLALVKVYIDGLKGTDKSFIEQTAKEVVEINQDVVYTYTRSRILTHKDKNHLVFFISGSPDFLVSAMGEAYDVTEYRGSIYEVDGDNRFTGGIIPMWDSKSKSRAIAHLVEKYGIDLESSYAYGDTTGDLSMLLSVGHPVAINPTRELVTLSSSHEYLKDRLTIIIERKDVVYALTPQVEILNCNQFVTTSDDLS